MVKIALDAGHGFNTAGKRTPDGEREWMFNDVVLRYVIAGLKSYNDVETLRLDDPTGRTDTPLPARTNQANDWKADALVSIHQNADKGKWGNHTGTETYIYPGSEDSRKLAEAVHPQLVKHVKLRDRGIKESDLHMLRESKMPAILTEGAFMDSRIDIVALRDESRLKAQADGIVKGLVNYFELKPKKEVASVEKQPQLTEGQEYIRKEAMRLKLTDGNDPYREVNQYYVWAVTLPIAKENEQLKKRMDELEKKIK